MRTMKIWRKSRLSECHANLFVNGRVRAIYVNIFVMCAAMLSLASCTNDDNMERRLTLTQKETYGQNISGEYSGEYTNVMLLNLNYGGADHHIRLEFNNNSQYYMFTEEELQQPKAFRSLAENGITLQLEAIYDGSTLIQRFGYENGNYMHIIFKASPL